MKAILVTTEQEIKLLDQDFNLKVIQSYLGGLIEAISFGSRNSHFFAYINEEGKLIGLPENKIATSVWYNSGERILIGDYLAGNVLFFGQIDDEGNETDVPDDLIEFFKLVKE